MKYKHDFAILLAMFSICISLLSFLNPFAALSTPLEKPVQVKFEAILEEIPPRHFYLVSNLRKLLEKYTDEELVRIYQDFSELKEETFAQASKQLDYIVTAGGPGAGKSTAIERLMESGNCPDPTVEKGIVRAYIDPDRTCLLKMKHTYKADIDSGARTPEDAYVKWRDASNFLANVYLAIALRDGYAIAHGSTMATPYAKNALTAIRDLYGYRTTILHLTCSDEIRRASDALRRKNGVVQCTEKDFVEKQALFLTLLSDYIQYSDNVLFSLRKNLEETIWTAKLEKGVLTIYDLEALQKVEEVHDAAQGQGFWEKVFYSVSK